MTPPTAEHGGHLAFTVSRDALLGGLANVSPALAKQTSLPILGNILFRSTEKGLQLSGTDLDLTIHNEIAADVSEAGSLTVPAKRVFAIAKELAPMPCRVSNGKQVVKLECGHSRYNLHSLPESEFPQFPDVDWRGAVRMPAAELQALALNTMFATSKEESRPILNGVLLQVDGETLRCVATDGHRLALSERTVTPSGVPFSDIIIPPRALQQVARLFGDADEIEVVQSENHLGIRGRQSTLVTRLIEGPYPNYRTVIPTKHTREIRVDRLALLFAAKRLVPIASDETHRLRVSIKSGMIELRSKTPDIGDGYDRVPVQFEGETLETAVNANYLLDILEAIDADEVRILSNAAEGAIVIKPIAEKGKNRQLYLIMPIRILED